MTIEWSPVASRDLSEIVDYLVEHAGYAVAQRQLDRIDASLKTLETFPYGGRRGRVESTLELVCVGTPYLAVYVVTGDVVRIVRLLHGKRKLPTIHSV